MKFSSIALLLLVLILAACSPTGDEAGVNNVSSLSAARGARTENSEQMPVDIDSQAGPAEKTSYTYLFVHGASGGGWDWKSMDSILTFDGHTVYRPTLTGLGEKMHLNSPDIGLTTHIDDICNVILFEDLHDVVLVGHSYGGMVITGVMNRMPDRIKHVVFLDAAVPDDGMSSDDVYGGWSSSHTVTDGIVYFSWLDNKQPIPRDVPQSLKTLTEPVSYDNPAAIKLSVTYIAFINPGQSEKDRSTDPSWQRAKARRWTIRTLQSDHNAQRSHPMELAAMLQEAPDDLNL